MTPEPEVEIKSGRCKECFMLIRLEDFSVHYPELCHWCAKKKVQASFTRPRTDDRKQGFGELLCRLKKTDLPLARWRVK